MSIYWYAYNRVKNEYFMSPVDYSGYSCIKPNNPFAAMVIMKNMRGYNFDLVNDVSWDMPDGCRDITDDVYKEYTDLFPWAKDFYEQEK